MTEPILHDAHVLATIGQLEAAGMAQHVRVAIINGEVWGQSSLRNGSGPGHRGPAIMWRPLVIR
jgi:ribosomal protein S28E/S33